MSKVNTLTTTEFRYLVSGAAKTAREFYEKFDGLSDDDVKFYAGVICGANMIMAELIAEEENEQR